MIVKYEIQISCTVHNLSQILMKSQILKGLFKTIVIAQKTLVKLFCAQRAKAIHQIQAQVINADTSYQRLEIIVIHQIIQIKTSNIFFIIDDKCFDKLLANLN